MANTYKLVDENGLAYFYSKLNIPTNADINTLINNALDAYKQQVVTVASTLPATGVEGILYMIPDSNDATKFSTYVWEESDTPGTYEFKELASASVTVDLTNYYTKTEVDGLLSAKLNAADLVPLTNAEIDQIMG